MIDSLLGMSALVQNAGFEVQPVKSYGLVETWFPSLTMSRLIEGQTL